MMICFVSDTMAMMAGTEHSVVMAATSLASRGHEVAVLAYCSSGEVHPIWKRHLREARVVLREIPVTPGVNDKLALRSAIDFLAAYRADIMHAIPMESLGQNFVAVAKQIGRGAVIGTLTSDPSPGNYWYHDLSVDNLRRYDFIICAAKILADRFRRYRLNTERVAVIPHVLNPPQPAAGSEYWKLSDERWKKRRSLGAITRLREEKGPDFLLAALSMIVEVQPDVTLTIYGELVEVERTHNVATALGIEKQIIWHGPFDGIEDIDRVVHCHCIFLLSSLFESMPISLMEVIARGRLVVATDVGAVAELLDKTGGGRLVPAGDPRAMADATLGLLAGDESLRRQAFDAGRAYHDAYSAGESVTRLERIYAESLSARE